MSLLQLTQLLTRPTASPQIGLREFDGGAMYETPYVGNRATLNTFHWQSLTSNFTLQNVTTVQPAFNATTNGAITVPGNTSFFFEGVYLITNTGTTSHTWSILFGGTATLNQGSMIVSGLSATGSAPAAGSLQGYTTTLGTALVVTAASVSATENVTVFIEGRVNINAGGTFIPQLQLSAAPGGTQTMLAGSLFAMWPLGPGQPTFVGQWS